MRNLLKAARAVIARARMEGAKANGTSMAVPEPHPIAVLCGGQPAHVRTYGPDGDGNMMAVGECADCGAYVTGPWRESRAAAEQDLRGRFMHQVRPGGAPP